MITETKDGWTFTHGAQTYGPFPSKESAATALYDLEHGTTSAAQIERVGAAYAALDAEDRPFADAITAWMDRVDDRYRDIAMTGVLLLEVAALGSAEAQEMVAALDRMDETERVASIAYAAGYAAGEEAGEAACLAELEALVEKRQQQKEAQPC